MSGSAASRGASCGRSRRPGSRKGRFFFFQAEDGIRDIGVTGVQTCALPISPVQGAESVPNPPALAKHGVDPRAALGWSARILTTMAVVIGTLAAAAPILDAVYDVWPTLRPEGRATALGMIVDNVQLEERRVPCQDSVFCNLVSFDLQLIGYTGAKSVVEWAAFDPVTLRRVPLKEETIDNQPGI